MVVKGDEKAKKAVTLLLDGIWKMEAEGRIWLRQVKSHSPRPEETLAAEFLGWYDEIYWYLLPHLAFEVLVEWYREQGITFPVDATALKKQLKADGRLHSSGSNPWRYQMSSAVSIDKPWVWRILKDR